MEKEKTDPRQPKGPSIKKNVSSESFVFFALFIGFFALIGRQMGVVNMLNTMMNTAYQLLLDTIFYIMAIAVLAGAVAALFVEFGIVSVINKVLSPLMKPIYGLPGASIIGVLATYLSDNPAILTLADDQGFRRYFKKFQLPALTNLGTAFGMGLIITTFTMGIPSPNGESFVAAALIGNLGAIIGSVVSVRMMLWFTSRHYGTEEMCDVGELEGEVLEGYRVVRSGGVGSRFMNAMLEGGKSGVDMGLSVIPGVLIICTIVMMLTNGPSESGAYTGAAYEGIALLPLIAEKLDFILKPLFGFSSASGIAVPVTALGSAGAAMGMIPALLEKGLANCGDVAVFTAMCMCWSGYLSTHVSMMDVLHSTKFTGNAIISHTIGGLAAGACAHWLYVLITAVL